MFAYTAAVPRNALSLSQALLWAYLRRRELRTPFVWGAFTMHSLVRRIGWVMGSFIYRRSVARVSPLKNARSARSKPRVSSVSNQDLHWVVDLFWALGRYRVSRWSMLPMFSVIRAFKTISSEFTRFSVPK